MTTTPKEGPTEKIKNIFSTKTDDHGNKITQILASQNEFVIYEIDTPDINYRLRVTIDGITNESEREIIRRFDLVKQDYIKAKGMLYRSPNFGMMKNRIAHALATCLGNKDFNFDGKALFNSLHLDLEQEQKRVVLNRLIYLLPSIISILLCFLNFLLKLNERYVYVTAWQISSSFLAASLGTGVSIFVGAKDLHFEEYPFYRFYLAFGLERVLFGFIVGAVALIAIKSGLISSSLIEKPYWGNLMVLVVAGFSEKFVPSIIEKVNSQSD